MSKHTPGPWRTARRGNGSQELPILRSDGEEIGCIRGEARLGDARLIAAAPDLLACLKEFVDDCDAAYPHLSTLHDEWPDLIDTYQKAKAAIAKAEGKET